MREKGLGVKRIGWEVIERSRWRLRLGGGLGKRSGKENKDLKFNKEWY